MIKPCKFYLFIYLFKDLCIYLYSILPVGQKRAPDLIIGGCEPPCGCWELNSGPLEEQPVLLTAEPSLQPNPVNFNGNLSQCLRTEGIKKRMKMLRVIQKITAGKDSRQHTWWRVAVSTHAYPFPETQTLPWVSKDQYLLLACSFPLRLTWHLSGGYQGLSSHHTWSLRAKR